LTGKNSLPILTTEKDSVLRQLQKSQISHLHWDHIQGFPFFAPAYIPGYRIHIYGYHPELDQHLNDTRNYLNINGGSSRMDIHLAYDGLEIEI